MKNLLRIFIATIFIFVLSYFISQKLMDNLTINPIQIQKIDWIVILAMGDNIQNRALLDRLDNGILAHQLWPTAKVLVVGEQSRKNEIATMKNYLIEKEFPQEIVVYDDTASSTWLSFEHAHKYIQPHETILVITNEFHQKRALATANLLGFRAALFGKDSTIYKDHWYHQSREKLSTIKWLGNAIAHKYFL